MGKRIVAELGLDQSTDTLSRWMAHRVAELMEAAEHARTEAARDSAARECESLILRLWERRTSWPNGWPPPTAAAALDRLASAAEQPDEFGFLPHRVVDDGDKTWLGTLPLIADLNRTELDTWRDAGLIELDTTEMKDWLNEHGERLSNEERNTFEGFLAGAYRVRQRLDQQQRFRQLASPDQDQEHPQNPSAQVSRLADQIQSLAERRAEILRRVRPPDPKKRPALRRDRRTSPEAPAAGDQLHGA